MDKTTTRTRLRGITGVDTDYGTACLFGFVLQEGTQLREAPGVHAPAGLSTSLFGSRSDVHQVLDNDSRSWFHAFNNLPTYNVVAVPPKPLNFSAKLFQMLFCGLSAFGLEIALQSKVPSINSLPLFLAVEGFIGTNGRSCKAKVYTDNLPISTKLYIRDRQNYVQKNLPLR